MENRNSFGDLNSNVGVSKPMAFLIDLNETPIVSPRERDGTVSICSVCGREVAAGRSGATKEDQREWKCFRCLLQNDGASSSGGAGAGFDINASPPREAEGVHPADHLGGGRESKVDGGALACHSPLKCPQIPNMLYLQTLRRYITERKGVLGEGWHVEFDFCDRRFRTSVVYVTPDGRRFKSMEDVASHLGIPLIYHKTAQKESSAFASSRNCIEPELNIQKLVFSGNGSQGDYVHDGFPIQFQDFCLLSAGNVDPRPAYHNTNQIWPVGYRCSWHDKITGSLFVCDVSDGGERGPTFKVQRFPCTTQFIPVGSAILSRTNSVPSKGNDRTGLDELATSPLVDDDLSIITLLNEHSSPCLENCVSMSRSNDVVYSSGQNTSSNSNLECGLPRAGNSIGELGHSGVIGEFQLEGRSTSSVWEMVSETFMYAFHEMFKQSGAVKFFCGHDIYEMNNENLDNMDSLSRYSYWGGPINVPRLIQNEIDFNMACEFLLTWLKLDRFGFNVDFVQEIIEQLPGVTTCLEYKNLKDRKHNSSLQSVGSGFLQVELNTNSTFRTSKRWRLQSGGVEKFLMRDPCPPGNPLSTRLPSYLIGDALQAWELAWRFLEVLGLGQPFSFQDLESELLSPWLDCCASNFGLETVDVGDDVPLKKGVKVSQVRAGRNTGLLLANIYGSLLKILTSELVSKVVVYACPNFDAGESKSRRGKKKDLDCSAALKKAQLDVLPVNELTWPEIARRYILSMYSMEGNLDSTEIASRESGKVFHCLRGDGGILCGSLSGIAALEGDAVVMADAIKEIFGPLKCKIEIVGGIESESEDDGAQTIEAEDGAVPEWAQVLEPVRKLPTNVGARIRRCVNEALLKNPPEWAKKMLEHSISKEVYKGNASGPTKRAVISVLAKVSSEVPKQQKTEKKDEVKCKVYLTDLVNKQCRVVLRHAVAMDEDRVFCNLLGRAVLNPNDADDGLLGYPAMVSRPLDFRTIDLRLAAGAYDGSHEAFIDDVREVWRNIRIAYGDRSDLIKLAENLSRKFEELYEKEVLTLVDKVAEFQDVNGSSADTVNEREALLASVMKSSLPRAPWEEGICKVCGMDKDDDNVLLCDRCDSEYHRYCLNPPLLRIPKGNWYCPSCVSGHSRRSRATCGSVANQPRKNGDKGEFKGKFLDSLVRLANLMEIKEYWEFTLEERIFFTKFLFDEALNSAIVRNHMDQCASRPGDLQNRLRSLTEELQIQKFKEETFVLNIAKTNSTVSNVVGDLKSDASSSLVNVENNSREKASDALNQPQYQQFVHKDSHGALISTTQLIPGHNLSGSTGDHVTEHKSHELQDNVLKLGNIRNTISSLLGSIASVESEILKVSLRKDFLGRDANGRAYWVFYWPHALPWIIANGSLSSKKSSFEEFMSIPDSDNWTLYEFDREIDRLIGWLNENNTCEKELKESILQLKSNKLKDSEYAEKHILCKGESSQLISGVKRKSTSSSFLATKAMDMLEKRFGPCLVQNLASIVSQNGRLYRCECLELVWITKDHCSSCHQSFPTSDDLRKHSVVNCNSVASVTKASQTGADFSTRKRLKNVALLETLHVTAGIHQVSTGEKQNRGSSFVECPQEPDFPFKFEEIMAFHTPNSVKDSVTEIGLIGSGGVPSFIPNKCTNLSDPALRLASTRINKVGLAEIPSDLRSWQPNSNNEASALEEGYGVSRMKCILMSEGVQISIMKDNSSELGVSKSNIVHESSLRPLAGRASEVLRFLKTILLDIDAALPEDALRNSRTNQEKRRAWRAFVKAAKTIYEMVQALMVLEDAVKSEYLHTDWWYWPSPSTAAKMTTLSALSLRIYSLDSAISYEKPFPNDAREIVVPKAALDEDVPQKTTNLGDSSSPPRQKTPESEPTEVPITRSRSSKRRKDFNG